MSGVLGMYRPGSSWLHRTAPGAKLAGLVVCAVAAVLIQRWPVGVGVLAALVVVAYLGAGLGLRALGRQLRPVWVLLAFTAAMNLLAGAWWRALTVPATIACLVALAALVTLTTATAALVDAIVATVTPLRRFGVRPERVGLTLLLGLRCVPMMADLVARVREAQTARSGSFSLGAFAAPLVIAAIRQADVLGEALIARGVDDEAA